LKNVETLLKAASDAYYSGNGLLMSDEQYDKLSEMFKYETVGVKPSANTMKHLYRMYSLKKYFVGEGNESELLHDEDAVRSPKLDGAAIAIYFIDGIFSHALTRGDGEIGQVIPKETVAKINNIPPLNEKIFPLTPVGQVCGEVVATKDIPNSRNYAAGKLNALGPSAEDAPLFFYAYNVYPYIGDYYRNDLWDLEHQYGFKTILDNDLSRFNHDGMVIRTNSNTIFNSLGYTNHHPRGAIAVKERKAGVKTVLKDVVWQVGKSGRVTPVALLEPVVIDGATITRATLNNAEFIRAMDLHLGDEVELIRSGDIIPTILGKWNG